MGRRTTDRPKKVNVSDMVWKLLRSGEYEKARAILLQVLEEEPDCHWALTRISNSYYEARQYRKALEYSGRALQLAPHCPAVLWDYAGALDMLGREEEAIRIWKGLIRRGVRSVAYGECGDGIRLARMLVNDCRYKIGKAYADLGKDDMAIRYLRVHVARRGPTCHSIYNLRRVKKKLKEIEAKRMARGSSKE